MLWEGAKHGRVPQLWRCRAVGQSQAVWLPPTPAIAISQLARSHLRQRQAPPSSLACDYDDHVFTSLGSAPSSGPSQLFPYVSPLSLRI